MRSTSLLTAVLLALVGSAAGAAGPSLEARIDAAVAPYVEARDFMGVVGVQRDGEEPVLRSYGSASLELGAPHWPGGVFRIGSIAKQFTAVAVLLLEESGGLRLTDPVARHLPGFPRGSEITIEQLLTHTAGVADVFSLPGFGATAGRQGRFEEVLAELAGAGLAFAPGSRYAYSNGGYALLAAVLERVSGLGYGELLRRRLFDPLAMTQTAHDGPGPAVPGRVPGYEPWGRGRLSPAIPIAPAYTTGSGSLWSSAGDLLRWSAALHGGRVLSEGSYAGLSRDHGHGYGYGVSVFERFGRRVIGHDGRVAGYAGDLARYLDERLTIVVLSNVESVARDEIRRLVAAEVLGEEYLPAPRPELLDRPQETLAELAGAYSFGPGFEVSVSVDGDRLLARANQGGTSELVPASGGWFSRMLYAPVRFGRDEEGAVDRLIWGAGERAPVGRKVR